MSLIQWQERFSVGISTIDRQHQRLIKMINELQKAMHNGKGNNVLARQIAELKNYVVVHFSTEEKLFEKYDYPLTMSHKLEHQSFVNKVKEFEADYAAGKAAISIKLFSFLSDWLRNHILKNDKKYAEFFASQGIL
ncbi:MAG: hypothetical protein Kow0037_19540 [Calditrichia bacterium]